MVLLGEFAQSDFCPKCGAKVHRPGDPAAAGEGVPEATLEAALGDLEGGELPELPTWERQTSHRCSGCGSTLQLERQQRAMVCPFCGSAAIVEKPPRPGVVRPAYTIPFALTREQAQQHVQRWQKRRRLFAPTAIRHASVDSVRAAYTPAYLYGAVAQASYDATIGIIYGYSTVKDARGRKRKVPKYEWTDLAGRYTGYLRDVLVSASHSVHNDELQGVEPFDLGRMVRFSDTVIAGWVVEEPALTVQQALPAARAEAGQELKSKLNGFLPGDSRRIKQVQARFGQETFDGVLVPLWLMTLKWHPQKPPLRTLINGQTGAVHGKVPLSAVKIGIALVSVVLIIVLLWLLNWLGVVQ
jgi:predicted RNA-binding Zn-ribbon protein involved in translation (DUF1610 family)